MLAKMEKLEQEVRAMDANMKMMGQQVAKGATGSTSPRDAKQS